MLSWLAEAEETGNRCLRLHQTRCPAACYRLTKRLRADLKRARGGRNGCYSDCSSGVVKLEAHFSKDRATNRITVTTTSGGGEEDHAMLPPVSCARRVAAGSLP